MERYQHIHFGRKITTNFVQMQGCYQERGNYLRFSAKKKNHIINNYERVNQINKCEHYSRRFLSNETTINIELTM